MLFRSNLNSPASTYPSVTFNALAYANGSTDYFEIYVRQESGSNKTLYGSSVGSPVSFFTGAMVRSA